ncbi:ribonuclease domain-containing protein [Streptomyces sp. H10-C2]|uniref:ribonuclease domain-containing protein n=1 Tax=unclassified Streptomyces TaxID=2593676 RepID=UPI0024BBD88F|nr:MULTISPECIES: ribonuclease domain-containing protein [unclassified Streptomyces]MDJ0346895.1 ribonuclease domain-containing protein [Streptomyces sp. PH10-H1]MDJ0370683.1 ribonuclease domain-containing protein [Streptomyces sp. H10-C2]
MLLRSATRAAAAALLLCVVTSLAALLTGCSADTGTKAATGSPTRTPASTGTAYGPSATLPAWAAGRETAPAGRLPAEARTTLALIDGGGPFPYAKDGAVFGNLEQELPREKRGYYHEYTVTTPGSRDRGARRIITGDGGEFYYTDDHYKTFKAVLR